MANVIRQDVIEIGFKTDLGGLTKINSEMDELKKSVTGVGKSDGLDKIKEQAKKASETTGDLGKNANKTKGVFDKFKGVDVGKLKDGLQKVDEKLTTIAKKAGGAALTGLKKLAGVSFKALAVGLTGAGVAIGGLVAKSVSAYADYEQLTGGVETLFKKSAPIVMKYANDAYKTAGLSANEYMETVTSFSASLLQSVGGDTKKAAKYADMAISDMSDNANKMGTDMGMIQNAYQGFAKQNYTMLDNLKLGYGGTKEEMARLVKDAAKLDKSVDANSMSYGNIVKAIHAVQKEMGILGTTQKEAEKTISGSLASMKSAWGNLLPALIQGGDSFDQCVKNLVSSVKTFAGNIMPAIKSALSGVGSLVEELTPIIAKELPSLAKSILPPLLKSAASLVGSLIKSLPTIAKALIPEIKNIGLQIIKTLYETITGQPMGEDTFNNVKNTIDKVFSSVKKIASGIISFGSSLATTLAPVLAFIGNLALNIFSWIGNNINWLLPLVTALVGAFILYKTTMTAINVVQKIMAVTSTLLGTALPTVAAGTTAAGTASATSATQIGMAAKSFMQMGVGVLAVGVGILAVCLGFALLTQSAIALAGAGWGAIAVMLGMVAAIALLAWGATFLGAALTAGAVGFLAFGGAVALVGVGFALIGVGALLAANSLRIVATVLPIVVACGLQGAVSIIALGASLAYFAIGAGIAGAAALILGTGLLVVAASLVVIAVSLTLITANMTILTALLMINTTMTMMFNVTLLQLVMSMTMITPLVLLFTAALLPLSATMLILMPTTLLFTASMTALMAIFVILAPMAMLLATAMMILAPMFAILAVSAPKFAKAIKPLAKEFTKLIIPTGLLAVALAPLSAEFVLLSASAVALLVAVTGLVASTMMLSTLFMLITVTSAMLVVTFNVLGTTSSRLVGLLLPLTVALLSMVAPLTVVSAQFITFAASVMIVASASMVITTMFTALATITLVVCNAMINLANILSNSITVAMTKAVSVTQKSFNKMILIVQTSGLKMVVLFTQTLRQMVSIIHSTNLTSEGMQLMNGLIRGMNSRKAAAISTARAIAQAINREFDKVQKIHSPSKVWQEKGSFMLQGGIVGMEKTMPKLQQTAEKAGNMAMPYSGHYTPESTSSYSHSRNTEHNTYSPQFSVTISGTNDDRVMARKVKRWIAEALDDTLSGYDSKTPQTQEV